MKGEKDHLREGMKKKEKDVLLQEKEAEEDDDLALLPSTSMTKMNAWLTLQLYEVRTILNNYMKDEANHEFSNTLIQQKNCLVYLFSRRYNLENPVSRIEFETNFLSLPYMTYRKDFSLIGSYQSDAGWGCMLRTTQMMLATALLRLHNKKECVMSWFADDNEAPLSIHRMVTHAFLSLNKPIGSWFEPTSALITVTKLLERMSEQTSLRGVVARDSVLSCHDVYEALGEDEEEEEEEDPILNVGGSERRKKACFIAVPVRLGLRKMNEAYTKSLLSVMRFPQSLGFIGGQPSMSFYFCGLLPLTNRLLYLDPHIVQSRAKKWSSSTSTPPMEYVKQNYPSCPSPKSLMINEIDPSLAIGFLVTSKKDFHDLLTRLKKLDGPSLVNVREVYPVASSSISAASASGGQARGTGSGVKKVEEMEMEDFSFVEEEEDGPYHLV